jgi:hypothetical protein
MAVEIKSGDSTDLASVNPVAKALHVINYSSDGHEGIHSLPVVLTTNSATAAEEFVIPSLNAQEYAFISLQLTGTWVATVIFEGSNDNTTFSPIATTDPSAAATGQTTTTSNRIIKIPVLTKFIRVRVSAYTSGTISAVANGHRDENSSGLISTLGTVTLAAETTKVIGTVNVAAGGTPTYHRVQSVTGLNATTVNAGATKMILFNLVNTVATPRFFKFYNKATAPTVGTDTPFLTIAVPTGPMTFTMPALVGIDFSLGLSYGITLGVADNDTQADTVLNAIVGSIGFVS